MFERFSKSARDVVADAYEVARTLGNSHIDTRHLVVALAERPGATRDALDSLGFAEQVAQLAKAEVREGGLDAQALASLGIDLESVRRETEKTFGPNALDGAPRRRGASMRFEAEAKKALELAVRETIRLKSRSISDEALTLGIIRADCAGRRVLQRCDIDLDALRSTLEGAA